MKSESKENPQKGKKRKKGTDVLFCSSSEGVKGKKRRASAKEKKGRKKEAADCYQRNNGGPIR